VRALVTRKCPCHAQVNNQETETRPFRSTRSVYHNKIVFTHGFILVTLSTAIFITTGAYNTHQHTQALLQVTEVNVNSILSQRERVTHPIGQS